MLDRSEFYCYLAKRALYRVPPARIGRGWKPLPRGPLVEHAAKTWRSFGAGRGHIFVWFCFRCQHCGRLSMFPGPNEYWQRYRCRQCDQEGEFAAGWYYLAINRWSFKRFNVVEGVGGASQSI